jgi:hypothetical protein
MYRTGPEAYLHDFVSRAAVGVCSGEFRAIERERERKIVICIEAQREEIKP